MSLTYILRSNHKEVINIISIIHCLTKTLGKDLKKFILLSQIIIIHGKLLLNELFLGVNY